MSKSVSRGTAAALCVLTAVASFNVSYALIQRQNEAALPGYEANNAIYGKLGEIREKVDSLYVGEYDAQDAVDMACVGYMAGVGDRWSGYLSKEEYEENQLSFSGRSSGIGVYTAYDAANQRLRILEVYEGSGAAEAGMRKGDEILGAEDKTLAADGYDAVIDTIRGEEGTDVTVTFRQAETGRTVTASMTRREVDATMVSGRMLDETTGYIRFYNFRQHSEEQFRKVLDSLLAQGAEKLVFDVRNDPGGAVDSLCKILDPLLPEGKIMTLRTKAGAEKVYESDADCLDLPMVVLVNADSISAAEFFAAALQEYGKATVVGTQTIGKGYSQRTYPLSDGSALRLSDQAYYTPKDKSLIGTGVTPDVTVELSDEKTARFYFLSDEEDNQLAAARAVLEEMSLSN